MGEKKINYLNDYSSINKPKRIFEHKNNENLTTTLKGSFSTSNMNTKIEQSNIFFNLSNISKINSINDFQQKTKEENKSFVNNSSIDNKKIIVLKPIKKIKSLNIKNSENIKNITDIIIPKLSEKINNSNNISEIENPNEIQKNIPILKLDNNNLLNNYKRQIPIKEKMNQNNIIKPINKIIVPLQRSASNMLDTNKYKRIFNTNTNTINDMFPSDEENKKDNGINNINPNIDENLGNNTNGVVNQNQSESNQNINVNITNDNKENNNSDNNNQQIEEKNSESDNNNKDNEGNNNTFKRIYRGKKRTKIQGIYPDSKKLNNKFLEKIKAINNKYPNKDAIMTHQIKLNKKSIIEVQSRKIIKMFKKQNSVQSLDTGFDQEIKILKVNYIEYSENNQQDLDNLINKSIPKNINNKMRNCGLSSILVHYIFIINEFSSIFLPLVDVTQKRKSFLGVGKLFIINPELKIFEDKKTKYQETKTINDEIIQKTSIHFISKELFKLLGQNSSPNESFLNFEEYKPSQEDNDFLSPKRYLTNKSIMKLGRGRSLTRKKKLTFIEKMTITPKMNKMGIKPISVLEKDEFFEVRKNVKTKDIKKKLSKRRLIRMI